jgi:hypothetical protein
MDIDVVLRGDVVAGETETERVSLRDGATLGDLMAELALAPQSVVLALVNEAPGSRATRLTHGDRVTLAVTS